MAAKALHEIEAKDSITGALDAVGLRQGDLVLVHSDASAVFRMLGAENWALALELLWAAIEGVLGKDGTLVVPTFNWDYCKGRPYDAERTPSMLGLFSNYIRTQPEALRSLHPIFPFAGIGPQARSLFDGISKSSFGIESVFDRLRQRDAKLLFLNTSFFVCSFVHHVEQMHGVSYRYSKHFAGTITVNGLTYQDSFEFYVRDEKLVVNSFPTRLGERMRRRGLLNAAGLGEGEILSTTCTDVFREAVAALSEDPHFLLKEPPVPVGYMTT
jgi:aminoglycoside 3-N-acetyltransferase